MQGINKKAYIFTLDAIFAIIILAVASTIILSQIPETQPDYYIDQKAQDALNLLSYTQTTDLCTIQEDNCQCPNYQELQELVCSGAIEDKNQNILELIGEHLVRKSASQQEINDTVHELIRESNAVEQQYGFSLLYTAPDNEQPIELYTTKR